MARFVPVFTLMFAYLAVSAALRLVLFVRFGTTAGVSWLALAPVLAAGAINDAVQSLYLFLPLVLLVSLLPDAWYRTSSMRLLAILVSACIIASLVFLAAAEFYFFEEFDARFNVVAFDYLMYPTEVFGDIRSEYPLAPVLAAAVTLTLLVIACLRSRLLRGFYVRASVRSRLPMLGIYCALLAAAAGWYPTDALSLASNRITNELIQNGHSSFFRAMRTSEIDYHTYYVSRPSESNLRLLARSLQSGVGRFVALDDGRLDREFP